jgi:hypothetical protein
VGPPAGGQHDLSITANNLHVTTLGEVMVAELRHPLELWSFTDGAWLSLEPSELGTAAARVVAAPPGPIYVRYGERWIVSRALDLDLGTTRLGWPEPMIAPDGAALSVNVDGLQPWQAGDLLQLYVPGTALWSLSSPAIELGATSYVAEYDLSGAYVPQIADDVWAMQMTGAAFADTSYLRVARSARPPVTAIDAQGIEVEAALVDAPGAAFEVEYGIAEFDRVRLEEQPLIASSWYDIGLAALEGASDHGHYDVSADLAIARFDDHSGRDAMGRMEFGDPFPPAWTRMATFVAWYPQALDGNTVFDSVWIRDRADALDGLAIAPAISAPRQLSFDGTRVRWLAPSRGDVAGYRVVVYRVDDGVEVVGELHCTERDVRIPPGMLPEGASSAVQVTAIAGPMDLSTAPFSLGLPYGEASLTSSIHRP